MPSIYLDNAATTPIDPSVLASMQPYFSDLFHNPSAQYDAARTVRKDIDAARAKIAHYLGARPSEIIFSAGGTEANNMAIKGVMDQFPGAQVLVSSVEHDSVLAPAAMYNSSYIPVHPDGRINIEHFITQISDDTVLVSVQYANNEIGTVQPISEIAEIIDKIRKERRKQGKELPIYFHTDACQASNYLDLHVSRLGVDLMTINASKIYGPKQIGGLYIKAGLSLLPQTLGGGQERGQRSGTENVPAIIGFASALSIAQVMRQEEAERLRQLQKHFISSLQEKLPSIVINGTVKNRLANNIHVSIPGRDNEELVIQLDDRGIICAAGSACRASSEEPSHVLKAIGLGDSEAQSSLRFTMGRTTTLEEINITVDAITEIIG